MADDDRNKAQFQTIKQWMLKNILLLLIIAAVVLGLIVGFTARLLKPSVWVIWAVEFPGNIYLSMIKLVILPLIMSSLICAIARLDLQHLGKMGGLTVAYYLMTTLLAVILGIALVVSIHPGNKELYNKYKAQQAGKEAEGPNVNYVSTTDSIFDVIRNLFPENIVQAMMQSVRTVRKEINSTSANRNVTIMSEKYLLEYTSGTNILGIIVFSLAFGIVLSQLGDEAKKMIDIIAILEKAVMKLVSWIMWVAPIGIFSLITGSVLGAGDFFAFLQIIGLFLATALLGLLLHCLVVLPALYFIITGQSPLIFLKNMSQAMITAFGIASSAATMPVTLNCLEEGMKIDKRITRFVIPLGATINMDGLALYESVAAIFIAQMQEGDMPFYKYLMITLITILSSIGAAAVPSGGIIAMVMVLAAIQLPAEDIVIIVTLDWFMDRLQTMANVIGDAYGACIIAHFCQDGLDLEPTKSATNSGQNDEESGRNGQEQPVDETESHLFDSMTKTIPPVPTAPVDGQNIKQYQDATRTVTPQITSSLMSPQTKY